MRTILTLRNDASMEKIEPQYRPLIDAAVGTVVQRLGDNLLEVRLLGSVARGCAVPGLSDLDLLAVTRREEPPQALAALRECLGSLLGPPALVSRIDLQCMSLDTIHGNRGYKLIVCTDSVNLYGEDHFCSGDVTILNTELARLWSPDIEAILRDYRAALENADIPTGEIIRYSRLTGKDLMKCFQRTVLLRHGLIERSVERVHRNLKAYLPQYSELFDRLWNLYRYPTDRREDVLAALEACRQVKDDILREGEDAR